jgi:hypothetical protein
MFNYKIVCDNGDVTVLRARTGSAAIKMYLEAMGCSETWFREHCKVRKILLTNKKFKLKDLRSKKTC